MKTMVFTFLIAFSFQAGYAQDSLPGGSKGTWVVESNVISPRNQIVKFYNSKLELIYEESVTNRKIRYEKERIKKALDRALEMAVLNEQKLVAGTFAAVLRTRKR